MAVAQVSVTRRCEDSAPSVIPAPVPKRVGVLVVVNTAAARRRAALELSPIENVVVPSEVSVVTMP